MFPQANVLGPETVETLLLDFGVRPWFVALLTLIFIPLVLCVCCWRNGTLVLKGDEDNPDAHGLFSPINAYLPITIPLNYFIFAFYESTRRELTKLSDAGVLPASLAPLLNTQAVASILLSLIAYAVALGLAVYAFHSVRKRGEFTTWLVKDGCPRPVAYYFYFVFFVIQLGLVFEWFLHHLSLWIGIAIVLPHAQLDAYDPDQMLGLEPLSQITSWSFAVISMVALLVAAWLVGARMTLRRESFLANPGHVTTALVAPLCAALVVIVPLLPPHWIMVDAKREALARLAGGIKATATELEAVVRRHDELERLRSLSDRLDSQDELFKRIEDIATWPVSTTVASVFPIGFLSPLFLPFFEDFGSKLLRRYRGWGRKPNAK